MKRTKHHAKQSKQKQRKNSDYSNLDSNSDTNTKPNRREANYEDLPIKKGNEAMNDNTQDLSKFGYRELDMAADLLKALANGEGDFLNDGITLEFNPNSGNVFVYDEEFNTGMMNGDKFEQHYTCGKCDTVGFAEDFSDDDTHKIYDGESNLGHKEANKELEHRHKFNPAVAVDWQGYDTYYGVCDCGETEV